MKQTAEELLLDELNEIQTNYLESIPMFKEWVIQAMKLYANAKLDEAISKCEVHCDNWNAMVTGHELDALKDAV